MSIKNKLRQWKNTNLFGLYIWNERRRKREARAYKKLSDREYIAKMYREKLGKEVDFDNPGTFTQKLQWLKLNHKDPLMSICADKYAVRDYIKENALEEILNPLLAVYEDVDEIDYTVLPQKFVLKGTHGSGWNIICKDKDSLNTKWYNRIMKSWLKQNIYYSGREWVYDSIPHRIVCEAFIDTDGEDLRDYKIFCFSGKPAFIQVDGERYVDHKRAYYDLNWKKLDFQYGGYDRNYSAKKPEQLEDMLTIAAKLSKPFPFSRIDLYNVKGKIIFGEITFFPDAGFAEFDPETADVEIGKLLELPIEKE